MWPILKSLGSRLRDTFLLWTDEAAPMPDGLVSWETYTDALAELSEIDLQHVVEIEEAIRRLVDREQRAVAVFAVGSVLNRHDDLPPNDIDLLLIPVDYDWVPTAEHVLARFIRSLDHVVMETPKFSKRRPRPAERRYSTKYHYYINRVWTLRYPVGRSIQLFILTERTMSLNEVLVFESESMAHLRRRLAYLVIRPSVDT